MVVMDSGLALRAPRNDGWPSALRRYRLFGLRLDLADRVDHGIEGQHRRGMPGLVIAHRLQQRHNGPLAFRPGSVFLQPPSDRLAPITQLPPSPTPPVPSHEHSPP